MPGFRPAARRSARSAGRPAAPRRGPSPSEQAAVEPGIDRALGPLLAFLDPHPVALLEALDSRSRSSFLPRSTRAGRGTGPRPGTSTTPTARRAHALRSRVFSASACIVPIASSTSPYFVLPRGVGRDPGHEVLLQLLLQGERAALGQALEHPLWLVRPLLRPWTRPAALIASALSSSPAPRAARSAPWPADRARQAASSPPSPRRTSGGAGCDPGSRRRRRRRPA